MSDEALGLDGIRRRADLTTPSPMRVGETAAWANAISASQADVLPLLRVITEVVALRDKYARRAWGTPHASYEHVYAEVITDLDAILSADSQRLSVPSAPTPNTDTD